MKLEIAQTTIKKSDGIAKTADFVAAGLTTYDVAVLCKEGHIERVRHGYYRRPGNIEMKEEKVLSALLPEGTVCVESALFHYGYSDFSPRQWTVAVPRTISRAKLRIPVVPLKAYYVQKDLYALGRTTDNFDGITLNVYNRERTICDCFKYRTKLDNELFNKAIHAYAADDRKNLSNLSNYARKMHLYEKVMNLMEVILNG